MKKLKAILSVAAIMAATATTSVAQQPQVDFSTFEFDNMGALLEEHVIFQTDGMTRAVGPNIVAQICVGLAGGTLAPVGTPVPLEAAGAFFEGFVVVGDVDVSQAFGSNLDYQIKAWDVTSSFDGSYANATIRGISDVAQVTLPGDSSGTPPALNTFQSFNLEVVPEPSTVALGVIGGLALLMRRRK